MTLKGTSTRCVHSGEHGDEGSGAVTTPIFQTSTFLYPREGAEYLYTRLGNPTSAAVEGKIAALEGGEAGLAFSSGMAAITSTLLSLLKKGDHMVAMRDLYGRTYSFLRGDMPRYGVDVTFLGQGDLAAMEDHIRENTRAVFLESPTNPLLHVVDLEEVAKVARDHDVCSVIDNTFATPVNQRPLERGFDLVVHSGSKYLNGHTDVIAGLAVGRGNLVDRIREVRTTLGGSMDPHAAYLLLRGMKTLALRMARHNDNGLVVASYLESHPRVERVHYPGLKSHPQHRLASRQMDGFGGMVSFEVSGSAEEVLDRMTIIKKASSLGGVESLASLPRQTSHMYLEREEREAFGIGDNLIRLSLGIEDAEDLIGDLAAALGG